MLLLVSFTLIMGCDLMTNRNVEVTMNNQHGAFKQLKHLAIKKGDTIAYDKLSTDYMDSPYDGFLQTALLMANKHDYSKAYRDVFYCLTDFYHKESNQELFVELDKKTKQMALDYLHIAGNKKEMNAIKIINELDINR